MHSVVMLAKRDAERFLLGSPLLGLNHVTTLQQVSWSLLQYMLIAFATLSKLRCSVRLSDSCIRCPFAWHFVVRWRCKHQQCIVPQEQGLAVVQDQVLPEHGAVVMFQSADGALVNVKADAANWEEEFIADCGESPCMSVPTMERGWRH